MTIPEITAYVMALPVEDVRRLTWDDIMERPLEQPEDRAATYRAQDRITRKIDAAPVLHSSEIEPYDPFGDMEAWGKAYESLDEDEDGEGE